MAEQGSAGGGLRKRYTALWIILILIVLGTAAVAIVWGIGKYQLTQVEQEAAERLAERTTVLARARAATLAQGIAVLSRDALAQGRTEGLQQAYDELVREPGLRSLTLMDVEGRAVVASDRKVLGTQPEDPGLAEAATAQQPVLREGAVFVPVMGYTRRLGTLRLEYDPKAESLLGPGAAPATEPPAAG